MLQIAPAVGQVGGTLPEAHLNSTKHFGSLQFAGNPPP